MARRRLTEMYALKVVGDQGSRTEDEWQEALRKVRYTGRLIDEHAEWLAIDVPRTGLAEDEYKRQRRAARRAWYRENMTLYDHNFLSEEGRAELETRGNPKGERRLVSIEMATLEDDNMEE